MSYQYNPYYSAPPSHPMPLPHAVPQAIPQPAGGLNMGHLRSLADHFDRAFAASQQVLLARISKQDALLSQQQESLSSISELLCNGQSESIKRHETLKAEVYDIGKKTDRITKGISESMKLLAAGTIKAITECQTTIERRLLCVEETCEGIKEEIRDPQANMDATVCREMAVGSDSPIRTVSYCDAATTPPSPPTPSFELPPQSPPCSASVRGRGLHSDQHSNNYVSPSRDNVSNQPPVSPLTSPSSTPETMSSSQNVLNTLLPVTADLRGTEQVSACSSPAPLSPALGSTHGSTISLPEPSVLLNKCLEMSKNTESQVTNFPNPTPQVRLLSRVESLSSLSSLSSDDLSDAPAQVPSAPAPSSRRGKAANVRSWTSPRKRRRSSPGPERGKAGKKPRINAQSRTTKSTNKELMDGNSSSLPSQPLHNATSRQFIQCNRCDLWYHWGCVGIRDDDPRLQDDADFACPLCQDHKKPAPRLSLSEEGQGERCSWPDCSLDDDPVEEFYIERIIGRYDRKAKGIERFSWLVKWEGYPAEDSTWTPESELPKPVKLIEEFKSTAEVEGILQFNSTLHLLREAVDAGWADRKV